VPPKGAIFLDRDGTIVRDVGYLRSADQMVILPGAAAAIRLLEKHGWPVVVVTNQSGVARGFLTERELGKIHDELCARLERDGAYLSRIYYCPHHPSEGRGAYKVACECRKPNPGMVRQAVLDLGVDPSMSYVVGDQTGDMELARRVGARGILIGHSGRAKEGLAMLHAGSAADLWEAVQWIIAESIS